MFLPTATEADSDLQTVSQTGQNKGSQPGHHT